MAPFLGSCSLQGQVCTPTRELSAIPFFLAGLPSVPYPRVWQLPAKRGGRLCCTQDGLSTTSHHVGSLSPGGLAPTCAVSARSCSARVWVTAADGHPPQGPLILRRPTSARVPHMGSGHAACLSESPTSLSVGTLLSSGICTLILLVVPCALLG